MSWLQEDERTSQSVSALLAQIQQLVNQSQQMLAQILAHHGRCGQNSAQDQTHSENTRHGDDDTPLRTAAYANLQQVVSHLHFALGELGICRTEMSHGGGL